MSSGPMIRKTYCALLGKPAVRPSPRSSMTPSIMVIVHTAATAPRKRHCGCFRHVAAAVAPDHPEGHQGQARYVEGQHLPGGEARPGEDVEHAVTA